jgi:PTH1 family peptidyl-tRNA hydrolase
MEPLGIVLGLGNPGATYHRTRHNLGFRVVDRIAQLSGVSLGIDEGVGRLALTAEAMIEGGRYILGKPCTYMNRSGQAGAELCRAYQVPAERLIVVYDDADLALGRIRVRPNGRPGGHNGVRSLIECLGTADFPRVKLGVRGGDRGGVDLADYVLDEFGPDEEPTADALVELGATAVTSLLVQGVTTTMDRFNGQTAAVTPQDQEKE